MSWTALFGPERTEKQLAEIRLEVAGEFNIDVFTCDDCPAKTTCEWAFDAYNTGGDCLAEK